MRSLPSSVTLFALALAVGCAASSTTSGGHGTVTDLSAAKTADAPRCAHGVPREVCARCNPGLVPSFKAAKDWCEQHDVPESQCFDCHPDLTFDPIVPPPAGADVAEISKAGEDVPDLAPHAARGKVTLFDFYAPWCAPCRKIDAHVSELLGRRADLAVRKLNVVSWETPLAEHYLSAAPTLPLIVVYDRDARRSEAVTGFDLGALDAAIEKAGRR
jgi:thiol-disulfide isomerase/thioredoxin